MLWAGQVQTMSPPSCLQRRYSNQKSLSPLVGVHAGRFDGDGEEEGRAGLVDAEFGVEGVHCQAEVVGAWQQVGISLDSSDYLAADDSYKRPIQLLVICHITPVLIEKLSGKTAALLFKYIWL